MADTTVKCIHSAMTGAPGLANVANNMVAVLNAALVDGFGLNTVDSLVITSGIATVTRAAGHPFDVGAVALISGSTLASGTVNGEQRVLTVTATAYTFDATGIANQTATGTISHKVAPLGWGRPFTGSATLQVYRSADTAGTRLYLRVDDTGTTTARVVGYEAMSTDSIGTGPFPTAAQVSGGLWWPKSDAGTSQPWMVTGDGRAFTIWVQYSGSNKWSRVYGFGDYLNSKSPDPWACFIAGATSSPLVSSQGTDDLVHTSASASANGMYGARGYTGVGGAVQLTRTANTPTGNHGFYSGESSTANLAYPNPADNQLYLCTFYIKETTPVQCIRGAMPGLYFLPHSVGNGVFSLRDPITGVTGYAGKVFKAAPSNAGAAFLDTTGPWR